MSSFSTYRSRKLQKPSTSNDVDRISNLPKSILYHILSLLPAEDAVATSLLSRSWKFHWTNIHNLNLNDEKGSRVEHKVVKFSHFVNKVLVFHNQQVTIQRFCLSIKKHSELYDVASWITAAVTRKVVEFSFTILYSSDSTFQLPSCLFTCKTLEVLALKGIRGLNIHPDLVCLPKLKTLRVELCDESVCQLISLCPTLEELELSREHSSSLQGSICLPNLKVLHLTRMSFQFHETFSFSKIIQGCSSLETLYVKRIYDDNVVTFRALSHVGEATSFSRLTRLEVKPECYVLNGLLKLVEVFQELEFLEFVLEGKRETSWRNPEKVPTYLSNSLKRMVINGFTGLAHELTMVAYILKNARVLRTMRINSANTLDQTNRFQLLQKVSEFPRESNKCQITFS